MLDVIPYLDLLFPLFVFLFDLTILPICQISLMACRFVQWSTGITWTSTYQLFGTCFHRNGELYCWAVREKNWIPRSCPQIWTALAWLFCIDLLSPRIRQSAGIVSRFFARPSVLMLFCFLNPAFSSILRTYRTHHHITHAFYGFFQFINPSYFVKLLFDR